MRSNLAYAQTTGLRAESTAFQSLLAAQTAPALAPINRAVNEFGVLGRSVLDLAPGNFERTGGNLDLAVEGPGFFAVQAGTGGVFTRKGALWGFGGGELVDAGGKPVGGGQRRLGVAGG